MLLLLTVLPLMAHIEEKAFRRGTDTWWQGVRRSFVFGLIHVTAGIPIGTAIALTIAGLWFTHQYFKGGVPRSTAYHAAWNLFLLASGILLLVVYGEWM